MKKIAIIFLLILATVRVSAQDSTFKDYQKKAEQDFENYRKQEEKDFNDFRDKANAEFAEYMCKSWDEFRAFAGVPVPPSPDPPTQPVVPDRTPSSDPLPFSELIPTPQPTAPQLPPRPEIPIPPVIAPETPAFSFVFYGAGCKVHLDATQKIHLSGSSEQHIADAWKQLSDARYKPVVADCLYARDQLKLCDWAYFQWIKTLAEKQYGTQSPNEAVLLQLFLLTQSGYKVRIARENNRLALLIPFRQVVYEYSYLPIGTLRYYIMDKSYKGGNIFICNFEYPKEQLFSLQINQLPAFPVAETQTKTFTTAHYPELKVNVSTNQHLIDFYNTCPITSDWQLYAQASLSETVKRNLYPALQKQLTGKSEEEAANLLLNFVQYAFAYQTDPQQFGYERPFFGDEMFFYPACDCEDRAILYSIFVRELLGLEVVLLNYPQHLATAVHFNETIQGDYMMIDGKKFLVCDPTFLGAPVGMSMSEYKETKAIVVKPDISN
ncbi:MAG: hypothetical protein LBT48_04905 [Prevotellaceae bacterium]|jgi:hypothetical protein|nr:hypothetical protein [Prevotellaceae bacterium]